MLAALSVILVALAGCRSGAASPTVVAEADTTPTSEAATRSDNHVFSLDHGRPHDNDHRPGAVQVRNVTAASFEIRFHEWDYLDGSRSTGETVSYIVAERGTTILPNGTTVQAGTTEASSVIRSVEFPTRLAATPVLLSTILASE